MMSAMSVPLTVRSNGLPSSRKPDFRSIAGTPGGVLKSCPRKPFSVSTALAPLRVMMSAASAVLKRVLTGTTTPPAVSTPKAAIIQCAELGAQMATRSPLSTPRFANAPAAQRTRSATSTKRQAQRTVDDGFGVAEPVRCAQDHLGDGLATAWSGAVTP